MHAEVLGEVGVRVTTDEDDVIALTVPNGVVIGLDVLSPGPNISGSEVETHSPPPAGTAFRSALWSIM